VVETWFTENWTIANDPGVNFTAPQPGSSITLNGDSNEFESAAWTYDTLWVTGNYECPTPANCARCSSYSMLHKTASP